MTSGVNSYEGAPCPGFTVAKDAMPGNRTGKNYRQLIVLHEMDILPGGTRETAPAYVVAAICILIHTKRPSFSYSAN